MMKTKILLLSLLCLSLAACGARRREQLTQAANPTAIAAPTQAPATTAPATPIPATDAASVEAPTATLVVQPTEPATEATATQAVATQAVATATVAAQSDPAGDQLEAQLDQLNTQNTGDENDINNLPKP
jgi:hypothetical protein